MARFVIAPQWQGSPSSRAMMLVDGAQAIAGDLPRSACVTIDVPLEAGEALDTGIHRFSALTRIRGQLDEILVPQTEPVVVVGGDCGVSVAAIGAAARRVPDLAVLWFDAHPDLHTPETTPSGAFSGMALSAVVGDGPEGLSLAAGAVPPSRVVLAGARSFDEPEIERAARLGAVRDVDAVARPDEVAECVAATGASAVYLHIDLDVLDPAALAGVTAPVPFGLEPVQLVAAIRAVRARLPIAGATLAGFAPASAAAAVDDLGVILRVVAALA